MLSRREKLLVQPWEDRRFKDHRQKVSSARAAVDAGAPAPRPHVARKLKKSQRERERRERLRADNFSLLQRLAHVMAVNRLDNHWEKPLPNFHQKVGQFHSEEVLRRRVRERSREERAEPAPAVKCYACYYRKMVSSARAAVDAGAPAPRPHVARKLKKSQRERERRERLRADNFSLLQRLAHVMAVNRLDNHWEKPLPNFHQKVGQFHSEEVLRRRVRERSREERAEPAPAVKCYACYYRKMKNNTVDPLEDFKLPSII